MANLTIPQDGAFQGDKSIIGDLSKARIVTRKKQHRDLDLSLKVHPIRKDIIPLKDDVAVKNAVKNLLITNAFERPFQPHLGANLRGLLFEPADAITELAISDSVRRILVNEEPRIKVLSIDVNDNSVENEYNILVRFLIKKISTEDQVEIVLRRLR